MTFLNVFYITKYILSSFYELISVSSISIALNMKINLLKLQCQINLEERLFLLLKSYFIQRKTKFTSLFINELKPLFKKRTILDSTWWEAAPFFFGNPRQRKLKKKYCDLIKEEKVIWEASNPNSIRCWERTRYI